MLIRLIGHLMGNINLLRTMMKPKESKPEQPLRRQCHHFNEIFISICTGSSQNDNFQDSQCWKFLSKVQKSVSVNSDAYGMVFTITYRPQIFRTFIFILYQKTTWCDQQHYHISFITCFHWRLLSLQRSYWSKHTNKSKRKYCPFDEIFPIGCTKRCIKTTSGAASDYKFIDVFDSTQKYHHILYASSKLFKLLFEISFLLEIQFIIFLDYHIEDRTRGAPNKHTLTHLSNNILDFNTLEHIFSEMCSN